MEFGDAKNINFPSFPFIVLWGLNNTIIPTCFGNDPLKGIRELVFD